MLDGTSKVALGGFLHLANNERSDLTGRVLLSPSLEPCVAVGVLDDLERDVVDVLLDLGVGVLATDEALGGEEGVLVVNDTLKAADGSAPA